jgi:hypothetical protein
LRSINLKLLKEVMNLLSKKQLAVENAKEIEAITNSLVKEIDALKKKVDALRESLKEDERFVR